LLFSDLDLPTDFGQDTCALRGDWPLNWATAIEAITEI
jgi:hypothetical protein